MRYTPVCPHISPRLLLLGFSHQNGAQQHTTATEKERERGEEEEEEEERRKTRRDRGEEILGVTTRAILTVFTIN